MNIHFSNGLLLLELQNFCLLLLPKWNIIQLVIDILVINRVQWVTTWKCVCMCACFCTHDGVMFVFMLGVLKVLKMID